MHKMSNKKTCFVIIGFGPKTDFETGNVFDLDKTFDNLIKPTFEELDIDCFRAKDIRHSGNIDVPMYEWILNADIVIADISTLNPNALYELGVRHALTHIAQ
jgi:exonuclease I